MTPLSLEFSTTFDLLYNNILSNAAPGLDTFEKSKFLSLAQESIVLDLYNGNEQSSFESSELNKKFLSELVKTYSTNISENVVGKIVPYSVFYKLPEDVMFTTLEQAEIFINGNTKITRVIPTKQDSILSILDNPFKEPNTKRTLRIDKTDNIVELINPNSITKYIITYLARPKPIILEDLDIDDNIQGINKETECKLHKSLYSLIIEKAVQLAKTAYDS